MKYLKNFKTIFDALGAKVDVPCVVSIDGTSDVLIIPEDTLNAVNGKVSLQPAIIEDGGIVDQTITMNSTIHGGYFIKDSDKFTIKYKDSIHDCSNVDDYISYMKENTDKSYAYHTFDNNGEYWNTITTYESAVSYQESNLETIISDNGETLYKKQDGTYTLNQTEAAESWIKLVYYYNNGHGGNDIYADEFEDVVLKDIYHWLYEETTQGPQVTTQYEI